MERIFILYWEDKERAEAEYGAPNILQKEITFGDSVMTFKELHSLIVHNYNHSQAEHHLSQYGRLIVCKDGNNTKNTYEYIQYVIFGGQESKIIEEKVISV